MYAPSQFQEKRREILVAAMRDIQLAAVVTPGPEGITATHVPVVVREEGERTLIEFHVARGNPHWKLAGGQSLAIFQGPHAYVHPGWYESKAEHGKVVPTWTYVIVHAHGALEVMSDAELLAHVGQLTDQNEAARPEPWAVSDAPEKYISAMARGIVGLRLTVERIEGSWKLNQHKPDGDRQGVQTGLAREEREAPRAVSELMRELERGRIADASAS